MKRSATRFFPCPTTGRSFRGRSKAASAKRPASSKKFPASAATTTRDGQRLYTVQEGETLSVIAQKFYGRKSAWKDIQKANKATVSSDGNVKAGQVLVIP